MKAIFGFTIILFFLISSVVSQTNSVSQPGGRNKPGFVYDSARKKFVLFGGFGKRGEGIRGDTWERDGKNWKQAAFNGPEKRGGMGMTFDSDRKKVVLFGGTGEVAAFGDTWEWDGKNWKQVAASGPSARVVPQLVYDARRKKTVLFGGFDNTTRQPLGDTWEWDGTKWSEISLTGPSPRFHHFMVYDSGRGKIVLFGGMGAKTDSAQSYGERLLGDTWEWDGKQWMEIKSTGPSARGGVPSMAFDSSRKVVTLFGGWDANGMQSDIWEWNGKVWKQVD